MLRWATMFISRMVALDCLRDRWWQIKSVAMWLRRQSKLTIWKWKQKQFVHYWNNFNGQPVGVKSTLQRSVVRYIEALSISELGKGGDGRSNDSWCWTINGLGPDIDLSYCTGWTDLVLISLSRTNKSKPSSAIYGFISFCLTTGTSIERQQDAVSKASSGYCWLLSAGRSLWVSFEFDSFRGHTNHCLTWSRPKRNYPRQSPGPTNELSRFGDNTRKWRWFGPASGIHSTNLWYDQEFPRM